MQAVREGQTTLTAGPSPVRLGAVWAPADTCFALASAHAQAVELCLFDEVDAASPIQRLPLQGTDDGTWRIRVPGVRPGQLYGYRVHGPYAPRDGHRFNPAKLLIDPAARAVAGQVRWEGPVCGFARADEAIDSQDSAAFVPKAVVVDEAFDWAGDRPPRTPWSDTVIHECHVKGLTQLHPEIPAELRGTYRALTAPPAIDHLRSLGVTAVELLPVQHSVTRRTLVERKLVNYWGYDPIAFTAPDARFASGDRGPQVREFQEMVKALHAAGIEVILDVVFNHTAEGDRSGPTLSLRGIDNAAYYRLDSHNRAEYQDPTGCGNCLNTRHPLTVRLVMDSLRYWVQQMHVDGFRFDLAATLVRDHGEPVADHPLLAAIAGDPVLADVKLIAEPWDVGPGGYQLGRFPARWVEWNDRYRDTVRRFWRGDPGQVAGLAYRLSGSSDYFARSGRSPLASVNYVASHDGLTLYDLVSYQRRHNHANGEHNHDGHHEDFSSNWGHEGPTEDPRISARRRRIQRAFLSTLAFSQGVPMLAAGDEMNRTQRGNNNAYCQDNEISWVSWRLDANARELLDFTRPLFALRRQFACFRRECFFDGAVHCDCGIKDVSWHRADGPEMRNEDWSRKELHFLGMLIHHHPASTRPAPEPEDTLFICLNGGPSNIEVILPSIHRDGVWYSLLDTWEARVGADRIDGGRWIVGAHGLSLLQWQAGP